ncbi:biotin/lipoyl-containing protein [Acetoanaerobium noterae]|uniref:biotin/lipoyl-containing protein n=1 Tax=Acetoanaerobium noterae TaxID=745369 RepID=UPI0028AA0CBA|nr:biotin/lipoyl-containing protein [Acetoanaerobium noterae]
MKKFNITVNGNQYEVEVEEIKDSSTSAPRIQHQAPVATAQPSAPTPPKAEAKKPVVTNGAGSVKAPMPGTINDIKVTEGQAVKAGDVLVILEAMKMENEIMSPTDGVVKQIAVAKGASVNSGDVLVVIA